ncbi:MAG: hypothetical protein KOO63_02310 [Bacteroidales bacterium]|nr:hypothetical protein [Candidatus Latescibacterota bacterium]
MAQKTFSGPLSVKMAGFVVVFSLVLLAVTSIPQNGHAEVSRRLSSAILATYTILDDEYWGMDGAAGMDLALRYELSGNIYLENRLGLQSGTSEGNSVTCFNGQMGMMVFATHFLPYRPFARVGLGLMSANPVTATPERARTFRPSQTTFYFVLGMGASRYIWKEMVIEAGADVLFAPYDYNKYSFDRQDVLLEKVQFTHFNFSLGIAYTF